MKDLIGRRSALQGLAVGIGAASVAGCAPEKEDVDSATQGLSPQQLLAGVEHVVVLMMENRSFDHYLGALAKDQAYAARAGVNGLSGDETNPAPNGAPVAAFRMNNFTPEDPPHSWEECHRQWNNGRNDGFVKEHAGAHQHEVMGYHDRSQIPLYYWFADNFAICDNWFASVMGPTWPNRFYLHATTSNGMKKNRPLVNAPQTIWDELKRNGVSAKNYAGGLVNFFIGGFPTKAIGHPNASLNDFFEDARHGRLPGFSMIDPDYLASDDHPSHNILRGQAFVASIYKALAESPQWSKTLFVITYDEHGGFYDHVPPPVGDDIDPEFRQLGFRVPSFVIGPMVKKGHIEKTQLEHSAVAATLRTKFDIRNLTTRMEFANDVSGCIDPAKIHAPSPPPPGMPEVAMTVDDALHDGVGISSQPLLDEMVMKGEAAPMNAVDNEQRLRDWLGHAVRLKAVRLIGEGL